MLTREARSILRTAVEVDARIENLRDEIAAQEKLRRWSWLRASRAGATYDELREETGYSDGMICKEIRLAREEAVDEGQPDLAERLARRRTA